MRTFLRCSLTGLALLATLARVQAFQAAVPAAPPGAPVIFSISPAQAEAGGTIIISGRNLHDTTTVWLGGTLLESHLPEPTHLVAYVPQETPPGHYSLTVRNQANGRSYALQVLPLRPVATSLEPDHIFACITAGQAEIILRGSHFTPASQVLLDGAIIRSRYLTAETLIFNAPSTLAGGMHQVAVLTGDSRSTPLALAVITTPEIRSITRRRHHFRL